MQRRNFMKAAAAMAALPVVGCNAQTATAPPSANKEIYEWRIYNLEGDGSRLDDYFKNVLMAAYNRKGVTIGAFKNYREEEGAKRFYLFVYPDIQSFYNTKKEIWNDEVFRREAQPFFDATTTNPAYSDFESYLCEAFDVMPVFRKPGKERTLFELRIYFSPNEEANKRKVKMFNSGEIDIFDKYGINSVCYGEGIIGPWLPSLMYLTWYLDEPTRGEAWKKFGSSAEWKEISKREEYKHTATKTRSIFFSPLPYSQL